MNEFAILGPTASGKSALAIELAQRFGARILSLDSLAVYREIDIASAKPSKSELAAVSHAGVDELWLNEHFSAALFVRLFEREREMASSLNMPLIVVGGSSFYLKVLTCGLSDVEVDEKSRAEAADAVVDLAAAYERLYVLDPVHAARIEPADRYRIQKAFEIFFATGSTPSEHFLQSPKKAVAPDLPIYEIAVERDVLRARIELRTREMLRAGLIDEAVALEKKYGRSLLPLKSIGLREVYDYLDGRVAYRDIGALIATHTAQLAKRQQTFNRTQFEGVLSMQKEELKEHLTDLMSTKER